MKDMPLMKILVKEINWFLHDNKKARNLRAFLFYRFPY